MFTATPITRGTMTAIRLLGRKEDERRSNENMPAINCKDRRDKVSSPAGIHAADMTATARRQTGRLRVENDTRAAFFLFA
jgi:hypothetical protein